MTHQQELELLAKWMGIEGEWRDLIRSRIAEFGAIKYTKRHACIVNGKEWDPSPEGNDTDFLNMVAGRVDIEFYPRLHPVKAIATARVGLASFIAGRTFDLYKNDKLAAMKHAAYQVCLMAAKEGMK